MMTTSAARRSAPSTFLQAVTPLMHWLLGHERLLRLRVVGVGLIVLVYGLCSAAAWVAVDVGIMQPWGLTFLQWVALPLNVLALALVRMGWTYHPGDVALILPQNVLSQMAIAVAYLSIAPADRGAVLGLTVLVVVFGMYAHTPRAVLAVGVAFMLMLGGTSLWLTRVDPVWYPLQHEIIRIELLLSVMPVLAIAALQLAYWRNRLKRQRTELKQTLAQVQQLATRDTLTGLYNRRHMSTRLEEALQRHERYGEPFTVALIDLDHFKQINDRHGHAVGDEVLASFGRIAGEVLRDTDVLARWGGEEFLVLLPEGRPAQAERALERLREVMATMAMSRREPSLKVTFSAGVSLHLALGTLDQTLERADKALYQAKASGRDRVVTDVDSQL